MEDILERYAAPYDPQYPVVCCDESPDQLVSAVRQPLPAAPGRRDRYDSDYRRMGTRNVCMRFQPLAGWRHGEVTERRTARDVAQYRKALVDEHCPHAQLVSAVLDNLTTHTPAALYETFSPAEARRLVRTLDFRYTPKHGSWFHMAALELAGLEAQCLDRRLPDFARVRREVMAWQATRNAAKATVQWQFTVTKARPKLRHLYPSYCDS